MFDLQRDGAVFVLRMKGGENRLNRQFVDDFNRALDVVEASEGEAALVTTGEERFYSNGLDLAWLATAGRETFAPFLEDVHALFARLLASPVATVAAINGHAFAAGAMLALAHDFRVMREDRGFVCLPEVDLATGQPLTPGMYAVLQAKLSPAVLHEMLVTGRRYGGTDAAALGIVTEAVPEADVLPRAIEVARGLAAKHRPTMAAIRAGLYESALATLRQPVSDSILP
ncbi:MAG: enoyl-CoA hydratase/isomerase family protein [Dehalococcoidia bacterium]